LRTNQAGPSGSSAAYSVRSIRRRSTKARNLKKPKSIPNKTGQ
jgi:hypothetical protein